MKADIAFTAFGKRSWEALEDSRLEDLQSGYAIAEHLLACLGRLPDEVKDVPVWLEAQKQAFVMRLDTAKDDESDVPLMVAAVEPPTPKATERTLPSDPTTKMDQTALLGVVLGELSRLCGKDDQDRLDMCCDVFGSAVNTWALVGQLPPGSLRNGLKKLRAKPSPEQPPDDTPEVVVSETLDHTQSQNVQPWQPYLQ